MFDTHFAIVLGFGIQALVIVVLVVWIYGIREKVADLEGRASKQDQLSVAMSERLTEYQPIVVTPVPDPEVMKIIQKRVEENFALNPAILARNATVDALACEVNELRERVYAAPKSSDVRVPSPRRVGWREFRDIAAEQAAKGAQ